MLHLALIRTIIVGIIVGHYAEGLETNTIQECPTWYYPADNDDSKCVCGSLTGEEVLCLLNNKVGLVAGSCMT